MTVLPTAKLYYEDAYITSFNARILSVTPVDGKDGCYDLILDRTAFFPEAGGQDPDRGSIAGWQVTDVRIKNGIITHRICRDEKTDDTAGVPSEGDNAECFIDWEHRFSNMQQHTGEHIFSGIVHRLHGYDNVGFHLSEHIVTMDYNGELSAEEIAEIELLSNQAIWEARAIYTSYPTDEELSNMDYRSKGELEPPIRIVEIEGVDLCACCAPHVKNTSEVGILKVVDYQRYKGGIRFSILCGKRALLDYITKHDMLTGLSHSLSVPTEKVPSETDRLIEEKNRLEYRLKNAQADMLATQIAGVSADTTCAWVFTEASDQNVVRNAVNELVKGREFAGVFYGAGENYRFIIGAGSRISDGSVPAEDNCPNANDVLAHLRNSFEIKGGGSPEMVQGSVSADREALEKALEGFR